jgi:hypothetical protein
MGAAAVTALQLLLLAVFGVLGIAKVARLPYMVNAAAHLGFTTPQYQLLGCLELAAVAGLITGLVWTWTATAAGIGLALQMAGAVTLHLRRHDGPRHLVPALVVLGLALAFVVARW